MRPMRKPGQGSNCTVLTETKPMPKPKPKRKYHMCRTSHVTTWSHSKYLFVPSCESVKTLVERTLVELLEPPGYETVTDRGFRRPPSTGGLRQHSHSLRRITPPAAQNLTVAWHLGTSSGTSETEFGYVIPLIRPSHGHRPWKISGARQWQ